MISADAYSWPIIRYSKTPFGGINSNPLRIAYDGAIARFAKFQLTNKTPQPLHINTMKVYTKP
jgi:hypothetical protein